MAIGEVLGQYQTPVVLALIFTALASFYSFYRQQTSDLPPRDASGKFKSKSQSASLLLLAILTGILVLTLTDVQLPSPEPAIIGAVIGILLGLTALTLRE